MRRADDNSYVLASNLSANGTGVDIRGGEYTFMAEGTVSGATISLSVLSPNGTWEDVEAFGSVVKSTTLPYCATGIKLPAGQVRMSATGGTPSALYAYLVGLG